jgi:hypothetical protein
MLKIFPRRITLPGVARRPIRTLVLALGLTAAVLIGGAPGQSAAAPVSHKIAPVACVVRDGKATTGVTTGGNPTRWWYGNAGYVSANGTARFPRSDDSAPP